MKIAFDIISDLYLDKDSDFNWDHKASSLFCIVAGNISNDKKTLVRVLQELARHYETVFFLDGDLEHNIIDNNIEESYRQLETEIEKIDGVVSLHENIIVLNDLAIIGTNGWTTFDFTQKNTVDETINFLDMHEVLPEEVSTEIFKTALSDQHYLYNSVDMCQTMAECKNIIIVTNSVPMYDFVEHNANYEGTVLGDMAGNTGIMSCLANDTENKVKTWVFGKFTDDVDWTLDGIRFINNPARDKDLDAYYPKRLEL